MIKFLMINFFLLRENYDDDDDDDFLIFPFSFLLLLFSFSLLIILMNRPEMSDKILYVSTDKSVTIKTPNQKRVVVNKEGHMTVVVLSFERAVLSFITVGNGRFIGLRGGRVCMCLQSAQLREH